jgi:flagellin
MSLGVLNNLNATYAESNLNKTSSSLSKVLQQLSSGSKINSGSDDAAGLSLVNGLQANQQALTQSVTNATEGVGLLQVADGALSQVTSLLNRAVTLATEVSNGTLNSSQQSAANQEYQSILSEITNIGATTTYNQQTVFGSTTNIYTGDSTTTGSSINSLNIRSLSSSNVGDSNGSMSYSSGTSNVFIDLSKAGKNAAQTDSLGASSATTTITVNYMTSGANGSAVSASANISVGAGTSFANTTDGLISAINNSGLGLTASFGTAKSAGTGATSAATAAASQNSALLTSGTDTGIIISGTNIGVNSTGTNGVGEVGTLTMTNSASAANAQGSKLSGTLSVVGSDGTTHTVTMGTANSTDTLANLASTINSQGWGVTATYNSTTSAANTANIVFTSASSTASVTQTSATLAGTTNSGGADTDTVALSAQPLAAGSASSTAVATISGATAGTTAGAVGTLTIGTNNIAIAAADTTATVAQTINAGNYGVTASVDSTTGKLTISSANGDSPTISLTGATNFTEAAANKTSSAYYNIGISGTVLDNSTGGGTATIGMSTDSNGSTGIATISYSDSAGTNLSSTKLDSQANAQSALTALNSAIASVSAQDGYIGAQINTLNAISSVMSTQQQNVQSAQNAVQATDYSTASSDLSKYEILSQTGISALAQANSLQQEVTKLLQ